MTTENKEVVTPSKEELLAPETKQEVTEEAPQLSEEEVRASQDGWVPKKEWKGNPDEWRPAKEFNERGELFTRIKSQSKELQELKQAMTFLTEQQRKQYENGYKQAIESLKHQRNVALEEGNVVKAQQITDKIDEVKDQQRQVQQTTPKVPQGPSETFKVWFNKNKWYTSDKLLTKVADAYGAEYRENTAGGGNEADMLEYVEKNIRKEFPQKFSAVKGPPDPDGQGRNANRGSTNTSSSFKELESSMTDEQRSIMKTILKSTGMSKEQYFKQYSS